MNAGGRAPVSALASLPSPTPDTTPGTTPDATPDTTAAAPATTLIARLRHHAQTRPDDDAVVSPSRTLSWAQLAGLVDAQAGALRTAGLSHSSVVGIQCDEDLPHLVLTLAAIQLGASSCTLPTFEPASARDAIARRCGVTDRVDASVCAPAIELAPATAAEPQTATAPASAPEPRPAPTPEARLVFSTSGTTGEPKLVVHSDRGLVAQAHRHVDSERERFACLASMEHNFAKRHRLYCIAVGATNIFLDGRDASDTFDAQDAQDAQDAHDVRDSHDVRRAPLVGQLRALGADVLHVSAFQAQELLAMPGIGELSSLRLKLGGSHVPIALRERLRERITDRLQAGYGTTETGAIAFTDPADGDAGESVGRPLPGIEVRMVDADRKPVEAGQRGEVAVRCAGMFHGYLGDTERTAARLEGGWFYTGDLGFLDAAGRIHLAGRSDDVFVFDSINIHPQDIESEIARYPGVLEACVMPQASAVHGQVPVALVVFAADAAPDLRKLKRFVRERVGVRCPRRFTIVDAIPKSRGGKVARQESEALFASRDRIRASLADVLQSVESIRIDPALLEAFEQGDADVALEALGLDSLARLELLVMLEAEYDIVLTPEQLADFTSLEEIVGAALSPESLVALEPGATNASVASAAAAASVDAPALARGAPAFAPVPAPGFATATPPPPARLLGLFGRLLRGGRDLSALTRALKALEHRLTPIEVESLYARHLEDRLVPAEAAGSLHVAVDRWLGGMIRLMRGSGKVRPEPFVAKRIAPTVWHFAGPGMASDKTLLVCFAGIGGRQMMMPNAVLMQHTDATECDLLVIAGPLAQGDRRGVSLLGRNPREVVDWVAGLPLVADYGRVRTLGCSAGADAAILAGHRLGAELAIAVGIRLQSRWVPHTVEDVARLLRLLRPGRAAQGGRCPRVLMSHATDNKRDRRHARMVAWLTGGTCFGVELTDARCGHFVLQRLAERGELAAFLARTAFVGLDDEWVARDRDHVILSLPKGELRRRGEVGRAVPMGQTGVGRLSR